MRHKLCRSFPPWCPGVKTRCLSFMWLTLHATGVLETLLTCAPRRSIVLQFFWHVDSRPISPIFFFFNSTFYLCIIIVIFYLMYLIHQLKLLAIVHHTLCANVLVIQTKVLYFHCTVPLVGWLGIEVEHLYSALKQSTNAVPKWALSRTSHSIATQCNN